jgi:hypothetical protein
MAADPTDPKDSPSFSVEYLRASAGRLWEAQTSGVTQRVTDSLDQGLAAASQAISGAGAEANALLDKGKERAEVSGTHLIKEQHVQRNTRSNPMGPVTTPPTHAGAEFL